MTNILPQTTKKYPCVVCKIGFDTKKDHTVHLKTPFHAANIKLAEALERIRLREEEEEKKKLLKGKLTETQSLRQAFEDAKNTNIEIRQMAKESMARALAITNALNTNTDNTTIPETNTSDGSEHKFICEPCEFSTNNKKDYNIHTKTTKHDINMNMNGDSLTCACGKSYKHKSSLCNHKKKCKFLASKEAHANTLTNTQTDSNTTTNSVNVYLHTGTPEDAVDSDGEHYMEFGNKISGCGNSDCDDSDDEHKGKAPIRKYKVAEDGTPEQEEEREEVRQIVIAVLQENQELQQLIMDYQELKYNLNRLLMSNENEEINEQLNELVNQMMQKQLHRILSEQFKNDDRFKNSKFCL